MSRRSGEAVLGSGNADLASYDPFGVLGGQPGPRGQLDSCPVRVLRASCARGEVGVEVVGQDLWLVDGDEGAAVVDPHQLGVLEVFG